MRVMAQAPISYHCGCGCCEGASGLGLLCQPATGAPAAKITGKVSVRATIGGQHARSVPNTGVANTTAR